MDFVIMRSITGVGLGNRIVSQRDPAYGGNFHLKKSLIKTNPCKNPIYINPLCDTPVPYPSLKKSTSAARDTRQETLNIRVINSNRSRPSVSLLASCRAIYIRKSTVHQKSNFQLSRAPPEMRNIISQLPVPDLP